MNFRPRLCAADKSFVLFFNFRVCVTPPPVRAPPCTPPPPHTPLCHAWGVNPPPSLRVAGGNPKKRNENPPQNSNKSQCRTLTPPHQQTPLCPSLPHALPCSSPSPSWGRAAGFGRRRGNHHSLESCPAHCLLNVPAHTQREYERCFIYFFNVWFCKITVQVIYNASLSLFVPVSFSAGQCELNQVLYIKGCVKTSPGLRVMDSYGLLTEERTSSSTSLSEWPHWEVWFELMKN